MCLISSPSPIRLHSLMESSSGGYSDIVKLLLDHGVEVNAKSAAARSVVPVCAFMLGCRLVQYIRYILPVYLCVPSCWGAG